MAESVVLSGSLQEALFDLLDGDADLASVPVYWGYDPDRKDSESISVGFEQDGERDWVTVGQTIGGSPAIEEGFRNQIVVEVVQAAGNDLRMPDERASVLAQHVEDALRQDVSIDGEVRECSITRVRRRFFRTDRKRGSRVFLDVSGSTRI